MDIAIVKFIKRHHVMTLTTCRNNIPWSSNIFYVFDSVNHRLIFTSNPETRHIAEATRNPMVSCSILLESRVIGRLQGAQISGVLHDAELDEIEKSGCKALFLKKFPYVALHLDHLWYVDIKAAKYTDNTLGFGKKLLFEKP